VSIGISQVILRRAGLALAAAVVEAQVVVVAEAVEAEDFSAAVLRLSLANTWLN
jgi:hypothetical protein